VSLRLGPSRGKHASNLSPCSVALSAVGYGTVANGGKAVALSGIVRRSLPQPQEARVQALLGPWVEELECVGRSKGARGQVLLAGRSQRMLINLSRRERKGSHEGGPRSHGSGYERLCQ
jgi:hypothetical protein